jgi:hypothetical protein
MTRRVLISGEPNRSGAGRDMGRQCVLPGEGLLLCASQLLTRVENRIAEGEPGGEEGAEVGRSADSTEETGPMKPGNRVEEKTLRTQKGLAKSGRSPVGSRRREAMRTSGSSGDRV